MPRIKFNKLPTLTQQRLLERQTGNEAVTIYASRTDMWVWLGVFAVIWLILLFVLSNFSRWNNASVVILGAVTVAALFFLIRGIHYFLQSGPSRNSLVVTRLYLVTFEGDYVNYQSIENLVTVNSCHKYQSGRYERTQIDLILEHGVLTVYSNHIDVAEDAVDQIGIFRKQFLEASERGDTRYLETNDDFRDLPDTVEERSYFGLPFKTAIVALILGVGVMAGAASANEYFDDTKSWESASETDRASGYRAYLAAHPKGRWSPAAAERLQALYDSAEAKYRASLHEGYDEKAANALSAILRYAKATGNYRIQVIFDRRVDVTDNLIEEIKAEFDVKKVLPLGDAFSGDKMLRRETDLIGVLGEALKQIFPDDILEVSHECSNECPKFLVAYETTFKDSIYYNTKEKDLPEGERTYHPGILINWNFGIGLPDKDEPYEFELESIPAETINYDTVKDLDPTVAIVQPGVEKIEKDNFYDAMVNSAFDDFRQHLVFQMGVGPPPKDSVGADSDSPSGETIKLGGKTDVSK